MSLANRIEDVNDLYKGRRITLETRDTVMREVIDSYRISNQPAGYECLGCALLEKVINGETTFCDEINKARMKKKESSFIIDNMAVFCGNYMVPEQAHIIDATIHYLYAKK
ncbi:MAG: hypothetical protein PHO02_02920 [Candidatus Nanoarchaeia archaeon]|nr:hypothetical protein [Candidatus Nanoarchaeia archaeon]